MRIGLTTLLMSSVVVDFIPNFEGIRLQIVIDSINDFESI